MMQLDHFSWFAGLYNKLAQYRPPSAFLDLLSLSPDCLMLDAAGGTGRVACAFQGTVRGAVVADLSRGMLRHAARKGLATVCTPLELLPFSSNTFDRVIIMDALHHLIDQRKAIHELCRILVPGGYLIIVEPDIHKFTVKLIAIAEKMLLMRSHFIDDITIIALLTDNLLNIIIIHKESDLWIRAEKAGEQDDLGSQPGHILVD